MQIKLTDIINELEINKPIFNKEQFWQFYNNKIKNNDELFDAYVYIMDEYANKYLKKGKNKGYNSLIDFIERLPQHILNQFYRDISKLK